MKKIRIIAMALFCFLMGCINPTSTEETSQTNPFKEEIVEEESLEAVEQETQAEIYMDCQKWDLSLYEQDRYGGGLLFYIYSRVEQNPEEIKIKIPVEASYTVEVTDFPILEYMPIYIYQAYSGLDWKMAHLLYEKAQLAQVRRQEVYEDFTISKAEKSAERREMQVIIDAFEDYVSLYLDTYGDVISSDCDIPKFYCYQVIVDFERGRTKTEQFQQIQATIGTETYVQEIGQVTLYPADAIEEEHSNIVGTTIREHYNGEDTILIAVEIPNNGEDIVLTKFYTPQEQMKIETIELVPEMQMTLHGEQQDLKWGIYEMDNIISWNGTKPLQINETNFAFQLLITDERMKQYEYSCMIPFVLEYTQNGEEQQQWFYVEVERYNSAWDICARAFLDIDVIDYYTYKEAVGSANVSIQKNGYTIIYEDGSGHAYMNYFGASNLKNAIEEYYQSLIGGTI